MSDERSDEHAGRKAIDEMIAAMRAGAEADRIRADELWAEADKHRAEAERWRAEADRIRASMTHGAVDGEGHSEVERRRRIRATINAAFERHGLGAPLAPEPPAEIYKQLARTTSGEPRKTWLGTFEIGPDVGVLAIPANIDLLDAADAILETSFQATLEHKRRSEEPEPPSPPVLRDVIWPDEDAPHE
jgi:hypothetical protein